MSEGLWAAAITGGALLLDRAIQAIRDTLAKDKDLKLQAAERAATLEREQRERRRQAYEAYLRWRGGIVGDEAPRLPYTSRVQRLCELALYAGPRVLKAIDRLRTVYERKIDAKETYACYRHGEELDLEDAMREEIGFSADSTSHRVPPTSPDAPG